MRGGALVLLLASLSGCARSCKNDHPYVPYSIGEAEAPDAAEAPLAALSDDAGTTEIPGVAAPAGTTRWPLEGLDLSAPADRIFVFGLARDLDGDGVKDALAIVRATGDEPSADELLFYKGTARGVDAPVPVATAAPAAPAADAGCARVVRLAQVGRRSASVELGASCPAPQAASRWMAVVSFDRGARVHFAATIVDPPEAPKLTIDADGADRDGDGIDDVALRVTIDAPGPPFEPMPRATAKLVWFDRPAGLSREATEPDTSLRALAQAAATKAARAKEAPLVAGTVHQVRALYAAMCPEGGAARLTKVSVGSGSLACGASRALEEAGFALARAYATMGDPVRAAWALDRAQLPPASKTPARVAEAQAWIAQASPVVTARQLRAIAAVPQMERGTAPAWGALAFEPSGKLLVRTAVGVVRVDPVAGDEGDADVPPWRAQVLSPDGTLRWLAATAACDGGALRASFATTGPAALADARDVALPIASPLGARCAAGSARGEAARALPLAWGPRGLEALVAGEPVLFAPDLARAALAAAPLDQPVTLGSPRSPSGKVVVVPTSQGIAVRAAQGKARLLRAKELEGGYGELQSCAVSDDATLVACVRGGRAFVGTWDAP